MDRFGNQSEEYMQQKVTDRERGQHDLDATTAWEEKRQQASILIKTYLRKVPQFLELDELREKVESLMSRDMTWYTDFV